MYQICAGVLSYLSVFYLSGCGDATSKEYESGESFRLDRKPYVVMFVGASVDEESKPIFRNYFKSRGYRVVEVKSGESTPKLLSRAKLYIVPGGEDVEHLSDAWTKSDVKAIRSYVRNGGRYYGVCLGGYWASKTGSWPKALPGFEALDILPAQALELYDNSERVVDVHWNGKAQQVYLQDGPSFEITEPKKVLKIYATFDDSKKAAALIAKYGRGKVGVSGIHVEAPPSWYTEAHLETHLHYDLWTEFVDDLLAD